MNKYPIHSSTTPVGLPWWPCLMFLEDYLSQSRLDSSRKKIIHTFLIFWIKRLWWAMKKLSWMWKICMKKCNLAPVRRRPALRVETTNQRPVGCIVEDVNESPCQILWLHTEPGFGDQNVWYIHLCVEILVNYFANDHVPAFKKKAYVSAGEMYRYFSCRCYSDCNHVLWK